MFGKRYEIKKLDRPDIMAISPVSKLGALDERS